MWCRSAAPALLRCKIPWRGFPAFFTTLAASAFVDYVQAKGDRLFGIEVYAQQVLAVIGFVISLFVVLYLRLVVAKAQKVENTDTV